jgi:hypothetical protein
MSGDKGSICSSEGEKSLFLFLREVLVVGVVVNGMSGVARKGGMEECRMGVEGLRSGIIGAGRGVEGGEMRCMDEEEEEVEDGGGLEVVDFWKWDRIKLLNALRLARLRVV